MLSLNAKKTIAPLLPLWVIGMIVTFYTITVNASLKSAGANAATIAAESIMPNMIAVPLIVLFAFLIWESMSVTVERESGRGRGYAWGFGLLLCLMVASPFALLANLPNLSNLTVIMAAASLMIAVLSVFRRNRTWIG